MLTSVLVYSFSGNVVSSLFKKKNFIHANGGKAFADAFTKNSTIKTLNLEGCLKIPFLSFYQKRQIGDMLGNAGAYSITTQLKRNSTIKSLIFAGGKNFIMICFIKNFSFLIITILVIQEC